MDPQNIYGIEALKKNEGFRNYFQKFAESNNIKGTIERTEGRKLKVFLELNRDQSFEFSSFLESGLLNDFIEDYSCISAKVVSAEKGFYNGFQVNRDKRKITSQRGIIIKGKYSNDQYDCISSLSADAEVAFVINNKF